MPIDVRIPSLGESVSDGVIVRWFKGDGDAVQTDEPLLELETDKASLEIPSPGTGLLTILKGEGETVQAGEVVAQITEDRTARAARRPAPKGRPAAAPEASAPAAPAPPAAPAEAAPPAGADPSPAGRRLVEEHRLDPHAAEATGRGGRSANDDGLAHLGRSAADQTPPPPPEPEADAARRPHLSLAPRPAPVTEDGETERVPMTRLRQRIAERLLQAQHTAAILTTFNEVDMSAVMDLRARHKSRFAETHGVALGFMSFFARACVATLTEMPTINAQIDGTDIVYQKRVHLGIAVATDRGLVVPVLHLADQRSFAEIEKEIQRLAERARQNQLSIDDLSGGTFTISNGGIYGSLLSTPILNPPQSAILGMHKIERRPVVVDDQVVIRPMMYLALSYDHRLIDGAEAVTFLVRVKERLEDPSRLLLDL